MHVVSVILYASACMTQLCWLCILRYNIPKSNAPFVDGCRWTWVLLLFGAHCMAFMPHVLQICKSAWPHTQGQACSWCPGQKLFSFSTCRGICRVGNCSRHSFVFNV